MVEKDMQFSRRNKYVYSIRMFGINSELKQGENM